LRLAYPALPLIGERLFRRQPGVFRAEASDFASFADAKHLLLFNTECVGREERLAQTGDLLFFFHADNARAPYHMMIYFREAGRGRLVYHTGVTEGEAGMMKEISVERLFRHPDPTWHPRGDNEHFLGFYRFKILA
ncbi:MAG: DUF1175 domain-containing protein, partial [Vicinamibacteria bacterium]|nr:DUF1175 domain-containing protein [Vicinamibacteria bacterium]